MFTYILSSNFVHTAISTCVTIVTIQSLHCVHHYISDLLQLLINHTGLCSSHDANVSGQWWITVAFLDLVNHPLISEILEQSAHFNERQLRSTISELSDCIVPYYLIIHKN